MANTADGIQGDDSPTVSRELDDEDLIRELQGIIESVASFGEFRRTQRRESLNLVRWMKMMIPMLEEIRDSDKTIGDDAYAKLCNLLKAFVAVKKLLRCCHDGSKIYLAIECEAVMARFHSVFDMLNQALDGLPYSELGVSDEVKEQIELTSLQLSRATRRKDTQDMELVMDLMAILPEKEDRNTDGAIIERLANKLELQTFPELRTETMAIKKLIKERDGQNAESTQHIVDLLSKFKQTAGMDDSNGLGDVILPNYLEKCPSLMIPSDFLCPITLEIMTDPVIVATGQTYERRSIQRWLDAGQRTCPKSRQNLAHFSLAPNFALRNLISQWCEKNKIELKKRDADQDENADQNDDIPSLVENLSSIHLDEQRKAVKKIRMLSKENPDNRVLIAKHGGIPALVNLLFYPDTRIQENTVTALLNLSIDEANKQLIAENGAIPAIIEILKNGSIAAKENSAAALFSLSMLDNIKIMIGELGGIRPLVDLLKNGTIRGKKDAVTALFNLAISNKNKAKAIEAGIVKPLLQVLSDKNLGMVDEALSFFLLLATHPDARNVISSETTFMTTLIGFIRDGTPKNKECALSVLLEFVSNDSSFLSSELLSGINEELKELAQNGTARAQRKAQNILQLMSKTEPVPEVKKPQFSRMNCRKMSC